MFIPLSDSMPCNRYVGTATYERLDEAISNIFNKRGYITDHELDMICQNPIKFYFYEEDY